MDFVIEVRGVAREKVSMFQKAAVIFLFVLLMVITQAGVANSQLRDPLSGGLPTLGEDSTSEFNDDTISATEVVVFLGETDVWYMRPRDRAVERWTKSGVGSFSASREGTIAYDRLDSFRSLKDPNVYLSGFPGEEPRKVTSDGQSAFPVISPDGTKIVYQKIEISAAPEPEVITKGLWVYDNVTGEHALVAADLSGLSSVKQFLESSRNGKDKVSPRWLHDRLVLWSADSHRFVFMREYSHGKTLVFTVDISSKPYQPRLLETNMRPLAVGKKEIFLKDDSNDSIVAIQPESGVRRRIAKGVGVIFAGLSPNENALVCLRYSIDEFNLSLLRYEGENWINLRASDLELFTEGDWYSFSWNRSGTLLVTIDSSEDGSRAVVFDTRYPTQQPKILGAPMQDPVFTILKERNGDLRE